MYPVATLERICADAWPPVAEEKIGEWRLRAASGYTGRANSALTVGDPGVPAAQALHAVSEFYRARDIPPKVQAVYGSDVEADLATMGWSPDAAHAAGTLVSVQVGPLAGSTAATADVWRTPTTGWWELVLGTTAPTTAQRRVITGNTAVHDVGYCTIEVAGAVAGAARGAVVDDMLYLSNLTVRPDNRRQGLASRLLDTLGAWAGDHGATACVLQVAASNTTANTLYAQRGFTESHRYRYWVPTVACEDHPL